MPMNEAPENPESVKQDPSPNASVSERSTGTEPAVRQLRTRAGGVRKVVRRTGVNGRPCIVCNHRHRRKIEQALLTSSAASISRAYIVPVYSVRYHSTHHMGAGLMTSSEDIKNERIIEWWNDLAAGFEACKAKLLEGGNPFEVAATIGSLTRLLSLKGKGLKIIESGAIVNVQLWQGLGVQDEGEAKALIGAAMDAKRQDKHALAMQAAGMLARYLKQHPERSSGLLREMGIDDAETQ